MKVAPAALSSVPEPVDLAAVDVDVQVDRAAAPGQRVLVAERAAAIEAEAASASIVVGPCRIVVPVPRWSPKVIADAPETVKLPVPLTVPPL